VGKAGLQHICTELLRQHLHAHSKLLHAGEHSVNKMRDALCHDSHCWEAIPFVLYTLLLCTQNQKSKFQQLGILGSAATRATFIVNSTKSVQGADLAGDGRENVRPSSTSGI
jgi:hypothetical protein